MSWEPKEGSGSLFQTDKGNERAPKWRGDIMLNGTVYELAGWVKETKKGDKFLSLSGKVKTVQQEQVSTQPPQEVDDSIPF
jgi:hypothetical protein